MADEHLFDLRIDGEGTINGTSFGVTGEGRGDARSGELRFSVTFSALAERTDPIANVLATLILPTGVFGREVDGAQGLLTLAGGEFTFRQALAGDGITAESDGSLVRSGERELSWTSRADGDVALADVTRIEPVQVLMIPSGPGKLVETIEWSIVDSGKARRVHAVRHFAFAGDAALPELQLREVSVEPTVDGRSVQLAIASAIRRFPRARKEPLDALEPPARRGDTA